MNIENHNDSHRSLVFPKANSTLYKFHVTNNPFFSQILTIVESKEDKIIPNKAIHGYHDAWE